MKIALLGYGKEGKSVEKYFKSHYSNLECDIFENFTYDDIKQNNYSSYDILFRSPSVPPLHLKNESSVTKYFFDHCPCKIIGVTATKGKGTICSFAKSLLEAHREDVYLVGNIGVSALDVLDRLTEKSIVVYEMSSFQLWDLQKSPSIAIIGQLEPDHLNVHKDYADYLSAKSRITKYQTPNDYLVYYDRNPEVVKIAHSSKAKIIHYPFSIPENIARSIHLPGSHNVENAIAAIAAIASFYNISPDEYLQKNPEIIQRGLSNFHGLPHRLEFIRKLNNVNYYDDNFSTNPSSTRVAIKAFPNSNLIIIIGGRNKTNYEDLPEIYNILSSSQVKKIILIGESGHKLAHRYHDSRFRMVNNLSAAVTAARLEAEAIASPNHPAIVLMSPAAASFDMFKNVYDRGDQFKHLVSNLQAIDEPK